MGLEFWVNEGVWGIGGIQRVWGVGAIQVFEYIIVYFVDRLS